jgi:hypothetical protein
MGTIGGSRELRRISAERRSIQVSLHEEDCLILENNLKSLLFVRGYSWYWLEQSTKWSFHSNFDRTSYGTSGPAYKIWGWGALTSRQNTVWMLLVAAGGTFFCRCNVTTPNRTDFWGRINLHPVTCRKSGYRPMAVAGANRNILRWTQRLYSYITASFLACPSSWQEKQTIVCPVIRCNASVVESSSSFDSDGTSANKRMDYWTKYLSFERRHFTRRTWSSDS